MKVLKILFIIMVNLGVQDTILIYFCKEFNLDFRKIYESR